MALNQQEMRDLLHKIRLTTDPGDRKLLMDQLELELEPIVAKLPMPKPEAPETPVPPAPKPAAKVPVKKAPAKKKKGA